jgi:hypothetical protein
MAWRAAASFLSLAVLLLSITRAVAAFTRDPVRLIGAGVIAGILAITAIGALDLSVSIALAASSFVSGGL